MEQMLGSVLIKNSITLIPDVNFRYPRHVPVVKVFNDH